MIPFSYYIKGVRLHFIGFLQSSAMENFDRKSVSRTVKTFRRIYFDYSMHFLFREHHITSLSKTTIRYCKVELRASLIFAAMQVFSTVPLIVGGPILEVNQNRLPFKFHIIGLPPDGSFSVNWVINFVVQSTAVIAYSTFVSAYLPMTMILMNHSCWVMEVVQDSVDELKIMLDRSEVRMLPASDINQVKEKLKNIIESTCNFIEWQKQAQSLLKFSFFMDFTLLSAILCMSATSLTGKLSDFLSVGPILLVCISQLFVYCWIGSRVENRFQCLSDALFGMNWDRLHGTLRNDVKLILLLSQNLKSFNGIFKAVDLPTFQKVC